MVNCPNCSKQMIVKEGKKKLCAQIGNPEIAIVETNDPHFCEGCNEYFLSTEEMVSTLMQIKSKETEITKEIEVGIYQ